MFDAHIQYYSYNNINRDDFGVGYFGNKDFWVHLINTWNKNDNRDDHITIEDWDELNCVYDFRGCQLAEVVPDENNFNVYWFDGKNENSMIITQDNKIFWENNPNKSSSVPRWVTRLKNQLFDTQN